MISRLLDWLAHQGAHGLTWLKVAALWWGQQVAALMAWLNASPSWVQGVGLTLVVGVVLLVLLAMAHDDAKRQDELDALQRWREFCRRTIEWHAFKRTQDRRERKARLRLPKGLL